MVARLMIVSRDCKGLITYTDLGAEDRLHVEDRRSVERFETGTCTRLPSMAVISTRCRVSPEGRGRSLFGGPSITLAE
jgi:hypothetical protein